MRANFLCLLALTACGNDGVTAAQEAPSAQEKSTMKHTNRLAKEKSPYLLQHAHNPVDWYPWGEEAFEKARKENKPIFLSIGYSTCHWCHVMERESFENEEVAKVLNADFVSIKVDREERPDVDQIYMSAVQAISGRGGWPLSAWLTPDLKPFFAGTYYPREHFIRILNRVTELWTGKREDLEKEAAELAAHLKKMGEAAEAGEVKIDDVLEKGNAAFAQGYEPTYGGFSHAPKFPHSTTVQFLLRRYRRTGEKEALQMAEKTLQEMAHGGIYDQLGGGFHRYSTDAQWIVPHFEKMLYDNALLVTAYLEAYQVTGKEFYARIARETLEYVLRDMTSEEGGFYSAEDADSEKIEGKFYVWNPGQVKDVLGEKDAERFMKVYDVTPEGNWDPHEPDLPKHQSVLRVMDDKVKAEGADAELAALKAKLFEVRSKRVRPGLDDKVLTAWNALMISAMAQAYQVLGEDRYREAAVRAAEYLLSTHRKEGKLLRTSRKGEAKLDAYLVDYAFLAAALLDLYETTFDASWFDEAKGLVDQAVERFQDEKAGGFFFSPAGQEDLIARMREDYEGPMPTGNSVMALTFLKVHSLTGEERYRKEAIRTIGSYQMRLERYPQAFAYFLVAIDYLKGPSREIVFAGPDAEALLKVVRGRFLPNKVVAFADGKAKIPVLEGRTAVEGKAAAYVCENRTCKMPVTDPAELEALLRE